MTLIVSCAAIILYFMYIADHKADDLFGLMKSVVQELPDLQKSLPPVLADVLDDRRRPDYQNQLELSTKLIRVPDSGGTIRAVVELTNNGNEVVSLLSLRIVVLDRGEPISEWTEWAATPFAADRDWRGPLLPGSRRYFISGFVTGRRQVRVKDLQIRAEITDIRLWNGGRKLTSLNSNRRAPAASPRPYPTTPRRLASAPQ